MKKALATFVLANAVLVLLCSGVSAKNMLIIGEDSDKLALPHDSRPFRTALDVIRGRLASYDITVYDESAVQIQLNYKPGIARDEAEVLEVAKAVKAPPLDQVAILALYGDRSETSYGQKFDLRMTAKVLSVTSGKVIGSTSSRTLEPTPLPGNCADDCLLEAYSSKVEGLALDVADQIIRFLPPVADAAKDCVKGPCPPVRAVQQNEFKIVLRYPTARLTHDFESWASTVSNSELDPIQSDRAQKSYWLKTDLSALELKQDLERVKLRTGQAIDIRMDGNTFELRVPN